MTLSHEYPKWLHRAGYPSVIVNDADAEAAQLAEWGGVAPAAQPAPSIQAFVAVTEEPKEVQAAAPTKEAPASNLGDWDGDGRPGGSVPSNKPANALTTPAQPKRASGWPKGKPRNGKAR